MSVLSSISAGVESFQHCQQEQLKNKQTVEQMRQLLETATEEHHHKFERLVGMGAQLGLDGSRVHELGAAVTHLTHQLGDLLELHDCAVRTLLNRCPGFCFCA